MLHLSSLAVYSKWFQINYAILSYNLRSARPLVPCCDWNRAAVPTYSQCSVGTSQQPLVTQRRDMHEHQSAHPPFSVLLRLLTFAAHTLFNSHLVTGYVNPVLPVSPSVSGTGCFLGEGAVDCRHTTKLAVYMQPPTTSPPTW